MSSAYFLTALRNCNFQETVQLISATNAPSPRAKNSSTLTKAGHFVNGVLSSAAMIALMQPAFTYKTFRMDGRGAPPVNALYNGLCVNAASGGPAEGVAFMTQEIASKSFKKSESFSAPEDFAVSCIAGALGAPINAAFERIMIQQQIRGGTAFNAVRFLIAKEGRLQGMLKGTLPTMGRDAIFNVGIFSLNETIQKILRDATNTKCVIASSMLSGAIAGILSTPCDLIKTKMQSDTDRKLNTAWQTARQILAKEGVKGLFQGACIRASLIGGATCTITLAKETIPSLLPNMLYQSPA